MRSAHPTPGRKVSITLWVTPEQRDAIDAVAARCGAFRAEFLRDCVRAGQNAVWEKHGLTGADIREIQCEIRNRAASVDRSGAADETSTKIEGSAEGESAVPATPGDAQPHPHPSN